MNKFLLLLVFSLMFSLSACGTSTSQPNPEPMPPTTTVPSAETPNGGLPTGVFEQPSEQPSVDSVAPGGQPLGSTIIEPVEDLRPVSGFPMGGLPDSESPVACTMDAKICPDGSAVGRTAPDCEFAPCPGE